MAGRRPHVNDAAPRHSAVRTMWPSTHSTVPALRIASFRRSTTPPACAATDASSPASRPMTHGSRWKRGRLLLRSAGLSPATPAPVGLTLEMSCFVMFRLRQLMFCHGRPCEPAHVLQPGSGMQLFVRAGYSVRVPRLPVFGIGLSCRSVFGPFSRRRAERGEHCRWRRWRRRPGPRCGGTLIRALCARAPAPVGARFAAARFARLIAPVRPRARAGRRTHLSCPFRPSFFAPAPTRRDTASGRRSWFIVPFLFWQCCAWIASP